LVAIEEAEDLTGRHLEIDAVDGADVAVALDEATDQDDRRCGDRPRVVHRAMVPACVGRNLFAPQSFFRR
jgi:hypothetical protein